MSEKSITKNNSETLIIRDNYNIKDSKIKLPDVKKKGVDALMSFKAIMTVVDRHRDFDPSDFGHPEPYIPLISLATPLAIKIAPMIQYILMSAHQM